MELDMRKDKYVPSLKEYAAKALAHSLVDDIKNAPCTEDNLAAAFTKSQQAVAKIQGVDNDELFSTFENCMAESVGASYYESRLLLDGSIGYCVAYRCSTSHVITTWLEWSEYDIRMGLLYAFAHRAAESKGVRIPLSEAKHPDWYQAYKRFKQIRRTEVTALVKKTFRIKKISKISTLYHIITSR
jgi:hypothetical protein